MHVHKDKTFNNQTFELEEVSFINCTLRDCDLFYSGGDSDWQGTNFVNCRFHWRGPAKNTVLLLQTIGALRPSQLPPVSLAPPPPEKPN
jgi:hypothetical protein